MIELFHEGLEMLSPEECLRLLELGEVGRVAITLAAVPVIFPVNYVLQGHDVLFATADGLKIRAALNHTIVAFEVDHLDPEHHSGWSVLVVGRSRPEYALDGDATHRMEELGLHPWAPGPRHHLVRIENEIMSGRRIPITS